MIHSQFTRLILAVALLPVTLASGQVVSIDKVSIGNPGNVGEDSGESVPGGFGPDRICGAVDYTYDIGKYEVTASQYAEFLNAVAKSDPYGLYNSSMNDSSFGCQITRNGTDGNYSYDFSGSPSGSESDWAQRPVNFVGWGDAARFSNWLHNGQPTGSQGPNTTEDGSYDLSATHDYYNPDGTPSDIDALLAALHAVTRKHNATWVIPTEDEWYKTAYHYNDGVTGNYWDYPTGSDSLPGYVNDSGNLSGTGAPFTEGGADPGNYATYNGDGSPQGIGPPHYRTVVGEWENSVGPYGTLDQGGNLFEWTEGFGPFSNPYRVIRGGTYRYDYGLNAAARNGTHEFDENSYIGFRVAEVSQGAIEIEASIDLKPGSCPNPLNLRSRKRRSIVSMSQSVLPMALLGSDEFEVTQVDLDSLALSRADGIGGSVVPLDGPPGLGIEFEDVATPFEGEACDCHDLDGDGVIDLSLKFSRSDLIEVLELDDVQDGQEVELVLSGSLLNGTAFEARDCVVIID